MKIAIVHEMLIKIGGAEKILATWMQMYPGADIYTLMYDQDKVSCDFPRSKIHPSVFSLKSQKYYTRFKKQRWCLPFLPGSAKKIDLSSYDLVLVSSSGCAHHVDIPDNTKGLIYYHAPARYLWDWTHEYRKALGIKNGLLSYIYGAYISKIRVADFHAAQKHTHILANSHTTQKRIKKYYKKEAQILYPPIDTERFKKQLDTHTTTEFSSYYIIISALTEFKNIDIALRAFKNINPHIKLIVIGTGDYRATLEKMASKNVRFVGAKYGDELVSYIQQSSGLVFPGEEDFGIVPIEAMSAGKPVFALKKGGLTETIIAGKTGDFFLSASGEDFREKFLTFHENVIQGTYKSSDCEKHAEKYDTKSFIHQIEKIVEDINT